ncbi:MAG TPA: lipid kinase [Gammaproteobacteria bacterium]|nr:lipid kinase [Gammaproteobacteria bacterium]
MAEPRALLMINRQARQGCSDLDRMLGRFAERGIGFEQIDPDSPEEAVAEIRRRAPDFDLIVLGGGDGTLRGVAAAVVESGLPLGILPLGTANDLARSLGIPFDPVAAVDVIADAETHFIDIGRVNGHYFFNAAHIGVAVTVTRRLSQERKQRWGIFGYARSLLEAWRDVRPFVAEVNCDGQIHYLRSIQVTVGNGRFFGGGMSVHEDSVIDDQLLDVYSLRPQSLWRLVTLLPAIRAGRHEALDEVANFRGRRIAIRTRRSKAITADGELVSQTPAVFEVVPAAVAVYVPRDETRAEGLTNAAQ